MADKDKERAEFFWLGFVIAAIPLSAFGGCGYYQQTQHWQSKAIEHGAAQYSPTTGKFEWKEKP